MAFDAALKTTKDAIEKSRETNFGLMTTIIGLSAGAISACFSQSGPDGWIAGLFEVAILLGLLQQWFASRARASEAYQQVDGLTLLAYTDFPGLKDDPAALPAKKAAFKGLMSHGTDVRTWFEYADYAALAALVSFGIASITVAAWVIKYR